MTDEERAYYGEYAPLLEQTQQFLLTELEMLLRDLSYDTEQTPIEHIKSRIKSPASMKEKLAGKGLPVDAETALKQVSDVIGVRIVTHFIGDIDTIRKRLEQSGRWKVIREKDYISTPKPNGYRSLHMILEIPAEGGMIPLRTEVQLRTIAMDCWASLEHQMRYKKDITNTRLLESELKRCADEMASTDVSMQTIRDMIK